MGLGQVSRLISVVLSPKPIKTIRWWDTALHGQRQSKETILWNSLTSGSRGAL